MTVDEANLTSETPVPVRERVLGPTYRWISIGMCTLLLLAALDAMGVTAVILAVAADLDEQALYALALAGPLAVSVIGMIVSGNAAEMIASPMAADPCRTSPPAGNASATSTCIQRPTTTLG